MKNTKRSITLKAILGYILLGLLVFFAVRYIYPQLMAVIYPPEKALTTNQKLTYTSNALSYLYEAETIGRTAMATGSREQFEQYTEIVDCITEAINLLQVVSQKKSQKVQLDSIKILFGIKTENIDKMVRLRQLQNSRNYYDEAISELIKEDIYFEDYANDPRLDTVDAYTKKVIVDFLEYIRKDNADEDQSMASMAKTVRETLAKIEARKKRLEVNIIERENNLLQNDRDINIKIRDLLKSLERESTVTAQQREELLNSRINNITETLENVAIVSILLAIGFVLMIFTEASRSQRYNKDLEESNAISRALLKSREQLMATITHDIRSPLNTVIGFTDLLQRSSLDSKQKQYLETVRKSGDYMLNLVNDLLDLSKLEAGKIKIEKIPFNPKELVEDVLTVSLPNPIKDGLVIRTELSKDVDQIFISDPFRIKQILTNLVTNAYKFTEFGSITLTANYAGGKLIFAVIDTGFGIPQEKQKLIFKEFAQADETTQHTYGGFGLGLSISQRLTSLLKGELKLKSKPDEGSTFTISIPVEKSKQNLAKSLTDQNSASIEKPTIQRIMLIDDEPAQIELSRALLEKYNLELQTAVNGLEALQLLNQKPVDLILTDIQMPVMDGVTFIKNLKKNPELKHIPVIALSGNTTLKKSDYRFFGFADHLEKPFQPREFIKTIERIGVLKHQTSTTQSDMISTNTDLFSINQLKSFVGNDHAALHTVLRVFCSSTEENLLALENNTEKPLKIKEIAHKMLPMMRQLEVEAVIPLLEKLEGLDPQTKPSAELSLLIQKVKEISHLLLNEINQYLKV